MKSTACSTSVRPIAAWPLPKPLRSPSPHAPRKSVMEKQLSREVVATASPTPSGKGPATQPCSWILPSFTAHSAAELGEQKESWDEPSPAQTMKQLDLLVIGKDMAGPVSVPRANGRKTQRQATLVKTTRTTSIRRTVSKEQRSDPSPSYAYNRLTVFCQPFNAEQQQSLADQLSGPFAPPQGKKNSTGTPNGVLLKKLATIQTDAKFFAVCREQASVSIQPQSRGGNGLVANPAKVLDTTELPMLNHMANGMITAIDQLIEDFKKAGLNPRTLVDARAQMAKGLREANKA